MEVKDIKPTAVATFKVKSDKGELQTITFTVRMLGYHELGDFIPTPEPGMEFRKSQIMTEALISCILGWDITFDGQPLPCTPENKKKWFPYLLGLLVVKDKPEQPAAAEEPAGEAAPKKKERPRISPDDLLGVHLMNFAGDPENFLKN